MWKISKTTTAAAAASAKTFVRCCNFSAKLQPDKRIASGHYWCTTNAAMPHIQLERNGFHFIKMMSMLHNIQFRSIRKSFVIIIWNRIYFSLWLHLCYDYCVGCSKDANKSKLQLFAWVGGWVYCVGGLQYLRTKIIIKFVAHSSKDTFSIFFVLLLTHICMPKRRWPLACVTLVCHNNST